MDEQATDELIEQKSKFSETHQQSGWTKLDEPDFYPSIDQTFDFQTGPKKELIKNTSCSGIFQLFFNDEILGKIVKETNTKARLYI